MFFLYVHEKKRSRKFELLAFNAHMISAEDTVSMLKFDKYPACHLTVSILFTQTEVVDYCFLVNSTRKKLAFIINMLLLQYSHVSQDMHILNMETFPR